MKQFKKFVPLMRVEESGDGLAIAYCLATSQVKDSENERCIYADTKPEYQAWSDSIFKSTSAAGQDPSLGNIRLMHAGEIAGKAFKIDFVDDKEQIFLGTKAVDKRVSDMLRGGFLSGMSQGGRYLYRRCSVDGSDIPGSGNWCIKCEADVMVDYAAKVIEVSYVDNPANPDAKFSYVKSDGSIELRKFAAPVAAAVDAALAKHIRLLPAVTEDQCLAAARGEDPNLTEAQRAAFSALKETFKGEKKTKRVAGEDLTADCFAYVGDKDDPSTWKLPIKFSTETRTKRHIRNALARFNQTKGIPDSERDAVHARIVAAAKEHKIDVAEESSKLQLVLTACMEKQQASTGLRKDLYDVSSFAELLQRLAYLWMSAEWEEEREADGSEVPEELRALIESAATTFLAMAEEEARELTEQAAKAAATDKGAIMNEAMLKAARTAIAGFAKSMGKIHKAAAATHEKMKTSHETMADAHKGLMKHYKAGTEGDGDDAQRAHHDFHKAAHAHHAAKATHHEKLHKAHMDAHEACEAMGESQGEGEKAAAALALLQKAMGEIAPAAPGIDVESVVAKAVATAVDNFKTERELMQKQIDDLKKLASGDPAALEPARVNAGLLLVKRGDPNPQPAAAATGGLAAVV